MESSQSISDEIAFEYEMDGNFDALSSFILSFLPRSRNAHTRFLNHAKMTIAHLALACARKCLVSEYLRHEAAAHRAFDSGG